MPPLDTLPPDFQQSDTQQQAPRKRKPDPDKVWVGETDLGNARNIVLPAALSDDDRPTLIHLRIMLYVGRQNPDRGWVEMSQARFAETWGYNTKSVNNAVRELVSWGYLKKLPQKDAHNRWCLYKVVNTAGATLHAGDGASDAADAATVHVPDGASGATVHVGDGPLLHVADGASQAPLSITESERSEIKDSENTDPHSAAARPSAGVSEQKASFDFELTPERQEPERPKRAKPRPKPPQPTAEQFERLWDAYPRRVDKAKALKCFMGLSPEEAELAIAGAAKYAAECKRERKEERYIKHPATWLNNRCFEDYGSAQEAASDRPRDYWWRENPDMLRMIQPQAWRDAVTKYANGTWSVETLGPGPWDPGCLVPQEVIDELGLRVKYPDPTEGALKPNWWYGKEQILPRYKPEFWESIITQHANGTWPIEYLGYGPWDERCLVHPKVMAKLGLKEKYPTSDGKQASTENANPSDVHFQRFRAAYPRQDGLEASRDAFMALSLDDAEQAISSAAKYAAKCKRNRTEEKHIAGARRWLTERAYRDYQPRDPEEEARLAESRRRMEEELEAAQWDNL
jgi:hypothetical protein